MEGQEGCSISGTHQLIDLGEGRVLDVQPVRGDAIQSRVVQHHLVCKTHTHTLRYWGNKEKKQRIRDPLQAEQDGKSMNSYSVLGRAREGIEVMTQPRNLFRSNTLCRCLGRKRTT